MFQRTVTRKVTNAEAKMALTILNDYYNLVINPHYEAKRNALPQKKAYDRIDKGYQSRSIQAHSAIITLQVEVDRINMIEAVDDDK